MSAGNEFTSRNSIAVPKVWADSSEPRAQAILVNCVGGGVNQRQFDLSNVVAQIVGAAPDEKAILQMLSQIRELRVEPPVRRAKGLTDVKLFRVLIRASEGRRGLVLAR